MLKEYLKENASLVESALQDYLDELKYPEVIAEGMKYSVFNGGKRLRPIIVLMTLELLGIDKKKGLPSASALELIHCYSLVHDDLPALDNDEYRRGKLTTHVKFGEAQGILIGDALLTHAFTLLSQKNEDQISYKQIVKVIQKISIAAGIGGMIGGQEIDIESEGKRIELPVLQYIHTHKTGMLIRVAVEIGAIIADADEKAQEVLVEYADLIGLAFQIKDDILDIEGDFEKLGKPIGSDSGIDKSTYPLIFGMEKSKEILAQKIERAKLIMDEKFGDKAKFFVQLADFIGDREN